MKLKTFILASFWILMAVPVWGCCCGQRFSYSNLFFRVGQERPADDFVVRNCELWQRQTSKQLSVESIREAIYDYGLSDWSLVYKKAYAFKNDFVAYLLEQHDTAAIQLLYYSKLYEDVRARMIDVWYYPLPDDEEHRQLEEIYRWANRAQCDRYASRQAFLRAKVMFALRKDEALVSWWRKYSATQQRDCLFDRMEGYVAGSMVRMGDTLSAAEIYARQGDVTSLSRLSPSNAETLRLMLKATPNADGLADFLQGVLESSSELNYSYQGLVFDDEDYVEVLAVCDEAVKNPQVRQKAMWQYVEAALLWQIGRREDAVMAMDRLAAAPASAELRRSIRLARFYMHGQLDPVTAAYEQMVLREMRWLDGELVAEVRRHPGTRHGFWEYGSASSYYVSDAMLQILLGDDGVCDRLERTGAKVRSLQLKNYAYNRLPQLEAGSLRQSRNWRSDTLFWGHGYYLGNRYLNEAGGYFNTYDFSNGMYLLADRMSSKQLIDYWDRVQRPIDAFDRFFSTRGQHDGDYWNDLIGMMSLRECAFEQAVTYLRKVGVHYQQNSNLSVYFDKDVFDYGTPRIDPVPQGRLAFAQRMADLAKKFATADPDERADAMLEYSIGLRNAFKGDCWWLISAGSISDYDEDEDLEWMGEADREFYNHQTRAMRDQARLQRQSLALYTDPERKARALARLYMVTKVMTEFPTTGQADFYRLHCDKWRDWGHNKS